MSDNTRPLLNNDTWTLPLSFVLIYFLILYNPANMSIWDRLFSVVLGGIDNHLGSGRESWGHWRSFVLYFLCAIDNLVIWLLWYRGENWLGCHYAEQMTDHARGKLS